MSKPKMPLDTDAYLADTTHLTTAQHGTYFLLLMAMWRSDDGWLPGDDAYLARVTRQSLDKWRGAALAIRRLLKTVGGRVTQPRLQRERQRVSPDAGIPGQDSSLASKPLKNIEPPTKSSPAAESATTTLPSLFSESKVLPNKKGSLSTLAADWQPTVAGLEYAAEHGFDRKAAYELAGAFQDHHRSKGNRLADWNAAWRMWVRNEVKFNRRRPNGSGPDRSASTAGRKLVEGVRSGEVSFTPEPRSPSSMQRASDAAPRLLPPQRRE